MAENIGRHQGSIGLLAGVFSVERKVLSLVQRTDGFMVRSGRVERVPQGTKNPVGKCLDATEADGESRTHPREAHSMILTAEDLSWKVGDTSIVEKVSLDVRDGDTLGLIGPNGSRKSTLLKLWAGILNRHQAVSCFKVKPRR